MRFRDVLGMKRSRIPVCSTTVKSDFRETTMKGQECAKYTLQTGKPKNALKWQFLRRDDGPIPTVRSTAELSTAEMNEFIMQIQILAAGYGVVIPSPGMVEE